MRVERMKSKLKRAGDLLLLTAAAILSGALAADAAGRLATVPRFWTAGGRLLLVGLFVGVLTWILKLKGAPGGRAALAAALLIVGAARWLRGTAAVPPDPPLLAAECIGVLLAWLAVRRRRREVTEEVKRRELSWR